MAGKPWYTNGDTEIQIDISKGEIIPDGFHRGRKPLDNSKKELRTQKFKNTFNQKSQEEKDEINQKRSDTLKLNYSNKSQEEKDRIIQKRKNTYNSKSEEEKALYKQKLSNATKGKNLGKTPWNKGLTSETDERIKALSDKVSITNRRKYGQIKIENPKYFTDWRKSVSDRMKQNGTYGTSSDEEKMFPQLQFKYGADDVIRQYSDDRYPFDCDFYIPSEDLFIEVNKHWTHGGHPFDETNLDDIYQLEQWQEKAKTSKFYQNAIYVWTDLDVRKLKKAKENKLNYKVIY